MARSARGDYSFCALRRVASLLVGFRSANDIAPFLSLRSLSIIFAPRASRSVQETNEGYDNYKRLLSGASFASSSSLTSDPSSDPTGLSLSFSHTRIASSSSYARAVDALASVKPRRENEARDRQIERERRVVEERRRKEDERREEEKRREEEEVSAEPTRSEATNIISRRFAPR